MGDLGDLSGFLKEGSVANLDWLDVDDKKYREDSVLPKQNLDTRPDLEALWDREDKASPTYLLPNIVPVPPFKGSGDPHTMGDMSQAHGHLRARAEDIRKIARLALMQSSDPNRLRDALTKRFDSESLRANRQVLAEVLQERGLLGRFYVAAEDFPTCNTGSKGPADFVRRFAKDARFVLAKTACESCACASRGPTGSMTCGVFHKEIQLQVPYTEEIAQAVEQTQQAKGKQIQVANGPPKERIRLAMLASDGSLAPAYGTYTGSGLPIASIPVPQAPEVTDRQLIQANDLLKKKREAAQGEFYARPIIAFLKREMLKGLSPEDLAKSVRLAFAQDDLKKTREHWEPLFKEAGLYGVIYATQDSFDDCHEGADFLAKYNPGIRAMVAGAKCESCIYNKSARCMMYGKPLLKEASSLYTPETVEAVLLEHRTAGRLPAWGETRVASSYGSEPREQLKAIHKTASQPISVHMSPGRMDVMKGFYGSGNSHVPNSSTKREILKWAARHMNEGLYGTELLSVLKAKFEPRDLVAAVDDLRQVLAEQGLQGIYYVDPAVYDDYGRGCEDAARYLRSRVVKYAKVGPKCGSCVLQTRPGFCSKLSKELVNEPPYVDKIAQQQAILGSGAATHVAEAGLVNNSGLSMMAEYQMQNGGMEVEVRDASEPTPLDFEFNDNSKVKL